jgi:hypothetical protein
MILATSKIIDLILIYPINAVIIFKFVMPTNPTLLVLTIWTPFPPNFSDNNYLSKNDNLIQVLHLKLREFDLIFFKIRIAARKELALMEDLIPLLHKLAQRREISGLGAYEQWEQRQIGNIIMMIYAWQFVANVVKILSLTKRCKALK